MKPLRAGRVTHVPAVDVLFVGVLLARVPRARVLAVAVALVAATFLASPRTGHAQSYPDRVVKLVVAFPPGGPADALGRILGERLSQRWGQPVIIENRGGGSGNVGAAAVARSAPDGYTLLLNASSHVINASLGDALPYDPVKDFTPVSEVASYMLVLVVHPSVPATDVSEFVAFARAQPGGLTVANAGSGTTTHLAAALFAQAAGVDLVHLAYRGAAPATSDLVAGHVPAMFDNPMNAVPQVGAGALRALAVTGANRLALLSEVPAIAERGYPGFETRTWFGLFGPAGMAPEQVARIYADTRWALGDPDVTGTLAAQGWDLTVTPPDAFSRLLVQERDRWAAVIRNAGIRPGN